METEIRKVREAAVVTTEDRMVKELVECGFPPGEAEAHVEEVMLEFERSQ